MSKYDIFISYRRDGAAETAKHLRDSLTEKGYKVFLDVESLRSGQFNTALYKVIEESKDFLLILPPGGLDRCVSEDDWVRLEVEHAHKCNKNIVPIMLKDFTFPESLPDSLLFLKTQNGLTANIEYYDAFVKNLIKFLKSRRRTPKSMRWIPVLICLILVGAIAFGCVRYFSRFPRNASQRNLVSELIAYMVPNLKLADMAGSEYDRVIDDTISFVEEKTLITMDGLMTEYVDAYKKIYEYSEDLTEMDDDIKARLDNNKFDTGELSKFVPALRDGMVEELHEIEFLYDYMPSVYASDDGKAENTTLLRFLNNLKESSELYANSLFLCINETFLPVTEESALADLKHDYLPSFTYIYNGKPDFISNKETLQGKQKYNENRQYELLDQMEADIELLEEDTAKSSWSKGVNSLTDDDTEKAEAAFKLCREYSDEQFAPCADSALLFVKNLDKHGLKGGVVVCEDKNNASKGTLEPGDIIYEVNGVKVINKSEFDAALKEGKNQLKIIRFSDDDFALSAASYDSTLGELSCYGLTE